MTDLPAPRPRRASPLVLAAFSAALASILAPGSASAHAVLLESQPAVGGTVRAGLLDIRLRYNSRIDRPRSRLTLTRPDRTQSVLPIDGSGPPDVLTAHADLGAGAYTLRWQVLATDGHITRGDVMFTVRGFTVGPSASATK